MEKGEKFIVANGPFSSFEAVVIEEKFRDVSGRKPGGPGAPCIVRWYECDIDIFGRVTRVQIDENDLPRSKDALAELLKGLGCDELETLQAMINGKLEKRTILPEQQATMQLTRKKSR